MRDYERKIRLSLHSLSGSSTEFADPARSSHVPFDLFNTRQRLITILAGDFYESGSFYRRYGECSSHTAVSFFSQRSASVSAPGGIRSVLRSLLAPP
jgi:hypothetical protein